MLALPAFGYGPAMGRPLLYPDQTICRLPPGTLDRIHAALDEGEQPADFLRLAVAVELARRELLRERESAGAAG